MESTTKDTVKKSTDEIASFNLPWSTKTLLMWLFGFVCFGLFIALLISVFYIVGKETGLWDIKQDELAILINSHGMALYICGLIAFLFFKTRSLNISVVSVWNYSDLSFANTVWPMYLGVVVAYIWTRIVFASGSWIPEYSPSTFVIYIITATILGPSFEEFYFRGLLYRRLRKRFTPERAIIFSSLIFSFYHIDYWFSFQNLAFVFVSGILFAYLFERTKSLTSSFFFHSSLNLSHNIILQSTYW